MDLYYISVVLFPESRLCEKYITILFIFLYLIFERKLLRKLSILYFVFLEFLYFLSFFRIFACIFLDFKKIHRFLISLIQVVIILLHINWIQDLALHALFYIFVFFFFHFFNFHFKMSPIILFSLKSCYSVCVMKLIHLFDWIFSRNIFFQFPSIKACAYLTVKSWLAIACPILKSWSRITIFREKTSLEFFIWFFLKFKFSKFIFIFHNWKTT